MYDSDVSVLHVSGNCFPQIDISIRGNMFPRTSKDRQICDVPRGGVKVLIIIIIIIFFLMPIHVVTGAQRRRSE